jgi:hypothetical protein
MCNISFAKEALNINIHNRCSSIELISPVYFSNGTKSHVPLNQQTDAGTAIETSFGIDFQQKKFKGALLYKLQRKHTTRTDNYLNSVVKFVEDTATNVYLLVVWDVEDYYHNFPICLVECTNDFTWDEDKLWAVYKEYNDQVYEFCDSNMFTCSMHGDAAIKTKLDVAYGSDYKLDIAISEEIKGYSMKRPIQIDSKRLVLLLLLLLLLLILIVLIYAVRLTIPSSFKLIIYNRCLDVDLVSPTYIIDYRSKCHRPPGYKVCVGDTTRSGFIIDKLANESYGVLIYRLQRKQEHESTESSEDTSSIAQLLVIWRISKSKELYADVLLIEHEEGLDKDDLRGLYHKSIGQSKLYPGPVIETWSLDANTALMTAFKMMNDDLILKVIISEVERDDGTRIPARVNPER